MSEKSDDPVRVNDASRLIAKIEPDTVRSYHEVTEDYLASIAVSLKRMADNPESTITIIQRLTALEVAISTLSTAITSLMGRATSLEGRSTAVEGRVSSLEASVALLLTPKV